MGRGRVLLKPPGLQFGEKVFGFERANECNLASPRSKSILADCWAQLGQRVSRGPPFSAGSVSPPCPSQERGPPPGALRSDSSPNGSDMDRR